MFRPSQRSKTLESLVIIVAVGAAVAGFVQGLSGFAFGLTSMAGPLQMTKNTVMPANAGIHDFVAGQERRGYPQEPVLGPALRRTRGRA